MRKSEIYVGKKNTFLTIDNDHNLYVENLEGIPYLSCSTAGKNNKLCYTQSQYFMVKCDWGNQCIYYHEIKKIVLNPEIEDYYVSDDGTCLWCGTYPKHMIFCTDGYFDKDVIDICNFDKYCFHQIYSNFDYDNLFYINSEKIICDENNYTPIFDMINEGQILFPRLKKICIFCNFKKEKMIYKDMEYAGLNTVDSISVEMICYANKNGILQ